MLRSIGPLDQSDKIQKGRKIRPRSHASNRRILFTVKSLVAENSRKQFSFYLSALDSWPIRLVFVLKIEPADVTIVNGTRDHCYRAGRESLADCRD